MERNWAELMEEGKKRYMAGEFPEATNCLRQAAELEPTSVETWRVLGFALKGAGNPSDAIAAFNTAIGLDSQEVESLFGLGLVQSETDQPERAAQSFDAVLKARPSHSRAKAALVSTLVKHGLLKLRLGDERGGGDLLERAHRLQPGSAETVLPFADLLIARKLFLEAFEAVQAAKRLAPNDPAIRELHATLESDPRIARAKREHGLV